MDKQKHLKKFPFYAVAFYILASIPITISLSQHTNQPKQYAHATNYTPTPSNVIPTYYCYATTCLTSPTISLKITPAAPKTSSSWASTVQTTNPCNSNTTSVQKYKVHSQTNSNSGSNSFSDQIIKFITDLINLFLQQLGQPPIQIPNAPTATPNQETVPGDPTPPCEQATIPQPNITQQPANPNPNPNPNPQQPVATSCGAAPADSAKVATVEELQAALNSGNPDITLTQSITANNINIPRTANGITLRSSDGVVINGNGWPVIKSNGQGGKLTLVNVRVDGQNTAPGEDPTDIPTNYYLPGFNELTICGGMSERTRRTGYYLVDTGKLVIQNNFVALTPRDPYWTRGSKDVLIENNLSMHVGDDGISSPTMPGAGEVLRSVIIRNNLLFDTLGIKILGGSADGTINGKPGQVLIEGNKIYMPGFYGIRNGTDVSVGEGASTQRNITVQNNYIENVRRDFPRYSPEQLYGDGYSMDARGLQLINVKVIGNTIKRDPSAQGKTVAQVYPTLPADIANKLASLNIPDNFKQFPLAMYDLDGLKTDYKFDLAPSAWNVRAINPNAINEFSNTIEGF